MSQAGPSMTGVGCVGAEASSVTSVPSLCGSGVVGTGRGQASSSRAIVASSVDSGVHQLQLLGLREQGMVAGAVGIRKGVRQKFALPPPQPIQSPVQVQPRRVHQASVAEQLPFRLAQGSQTAGRSDVQGGSGHCDPLKCINEGGDVVKPDECHFQMSTTQVSMLCANP